MDYDDAENDYFEPYDCNDPRNESLPDSVVYTDTFKELKSHCQQAVFMVRDVLAASSYQNAATQGLLEEVKKRFKTTTGEQTFFALSGDMAAGKSSVINSILSTGVIARKGAGGGSCTWVVQRFMSAFEGQTHPYTAKVYFFTTQEIREIMRSMLIKYHRATSTSIKDEQDDEEGEDVKSENYNEVRTVLDMLASLFCDKAEFETDGAARDYLSKAEAEDDDAIVDELTTWAVDVVSDHLENKDMVTLGKYTPDELLFALQPYTYRLGGEEGEGVPDPWPLVSVIDFGLDVPLLRSGIVLVDAPGISDSNSARRDNSVRYQRQCTHKITVAPIARAKDDRSLREGLTQGYRHRGSAGNTLVLTRGDDMDPDTEVAGTKIEKKRETELKNEIKILRDQKNKLAQQKRKLSRVDALEIDDQISDKVKLLQEKMAEYDTCRLFMRNKTVVKAVQEQYRDMTRDPKALSAFVVANEAYKQHQTGYDALNKPTLSVKETGIPDLRARIWSVPAEGKLNEALHMANIQIPDLLSFFELFVSKTHMARKSEIEAIILGPPHEFQEIVSRHHEKLMASVQQNILRPMKGKEADWVRAARKLCQQWATQYGKNHLWIMKKEGHKKGTKKMQEVNWNKALLSAGNHKGTIEDNFTEEQNDLQPIFSDLGGELRALLKTTRAKIRNDPSFNVMALGKFLESFDLEKGKVAEKLEDTFRKTRRELSNIQQDATVSSSTAFLDKAMAPIYARIITIKGSGGPKKRMAEFEKEVANMSGIWMKIHDSIEQAFSKLFQERLETIRKTMCESFDTILHKFNLLCEDTAVKDEKEKLQEEELRIKLKKQLVEAKKLLDGPIRAKAAECKDYGTNKDPNSLFVGEG